MYPFERSLVERLKDKPFILLGVNSDKDRQKLKEVMQKENITWRSWWDDGSGHGPIARRWNVEAWPSIFIIDHKGNVRYTPGEEKEIVRGINTLLYELENEGSLSRK